MSREKLRDPGIWVFPTGFCSRVIAFCSSAASALSVRADTALHPDASAAFPRGAPRLGPPSRRRCSLGPPVCALCPIPLPRGFYRALLLFWLIPPVSPIPAANLAAPIRLEGLLLAPRVLGSRRASQGPRCLPAVAPDQGFPASSLGRSQPSFCPRNQRAVTTPGEILPSGTKTAETASIAR